VSIDCLAAAFGRLDQTLLLLVAVSAMNAQTAAPLLTIRPPAGGEQLDSVEQFLRFERGSSHWRPNGFRADGGRSEHGTRRCLTIRTQAAAGIRSAFIGFAPASEAAGTMTGKIKSCIRQTGFVSPNFDTAVRWVKIAILLNDPTRVY